jgi:hypothetical protein
MSGCIGEPISWLRLERFGLGELPAIEQGDVAQHLANCAVCRACFAAIDSPVELPPLPRPIARPQRPGWLRSTAWLGGLSAALAALLLFLWLPEPGPGPGLEPPQSRLRVKGGEIALALVRIDPRGRQLAADRFERGDRFKILVTCPASLSARVEAVVYQAGRAYFPLDPQTLERCGNLRALDGAFQLDGTDPAVVCVAISDTKPLSRSELAKGVRGLPELSVCTRVEAGQTAR